jgi:hypothetical protein
MLDRRKEKRSSTFSEMAEKGRFNKLMCKYPGFTRWIKVPFIIEDDVAIPDDYRARFINFALRGVRVSDWRK